MADVYPDTGNAKVDVDAILDRAGNVVDDVRDLLLEAWYFGYTNGLADAAKAEEGLAAAGHVIEVQGPIAYPGGKDGLYIAHCSCGEWSSTFDTDAEVRKSGAQHVRAKARTWNPMKQAFE